MPCYCSKIEQYRNDISKIESALTFINLMEARSDDEITAEITLLKENLNCVSPDNLTELISAAGKINSIPSFKIGSMSTCCTLEISTLNAQIDVMVMQDQVHHAEEAAAAAAASSGG